MATKRIALFGSTSHLAITACAAALEAIGARPQYRNEHAYNSHPSQHEPFDAVVVVDASEPAALVIETHRERDVTVFVIADVQTREEFLADPGAHDFLDFIGGHLEEQKEAIDDSITDLQRVIDSSGANADLPKVADLAGVLEQLDVEGVTEMQARDARKTAAPLYAARLVALTPPAQVPETPADGSVIEPEAPPA